jgi:hypothetical protein
MKAALRDKHKSRSDKRKNTSEGKQKAPFDNPETDSKEKKIVSKIQTDC